MANDGGRTYWCHLEYGKNLEPSSEGLGDLVQKSEDQLQLEEVCKLKRKLP